MAVAINNKFGVLLAQKRIKEKRQISLQEIQEATSISRKTLWMWQGNSVTRFDTKIIDALCIYFGVQPGELLEHVADPPSSKKKAARKK